MDLHSRVPGETATTASKDLRHKDVTKPPQRSRANIGSKSENMIRSDSEGPKTVATHTPQLMNIKLDQGTNWKDRRSFGDDGTAITAITMTDVIDQFLAGEFDSGDSLWDLVVLTGSQDIWASTVGQYVSWRWPESERIIKDLFTVIEATTKGPKKEAWLGFDLSRSAVKVEIDRNLARTTTRTWKNLFLTTYTSKTTIVLRGARSQVVELEQALIWLNAVLLPVDGQSGPAAASVKQQRQLTGILSSAELELEGRVKGSLHVPASHSCWTGLFPRTSCAVDFWTPQRHPFMHGIEISFELMCLLAGIEYEVDEQDGLMLYGPKAAIYPVSFHEDCVQWHLEDLEFGKPTNLQKKRDGMPHQDSELLKTAKRHFLGLWRDASVLLGTSDMDCAKLRWSDLKELQTESSMSEYSFGTSIALPKVLTLNVSQTYKIARSRRNQYMVNFEANLHRMIQAPVLLYSPSEKRGWLVSYTSVLLYLARARASYQHSLGFSIPPCEKANDGGQAAFDRLKSCKDDFLKSNSKRNEDGPRIEHYIKEAMAAMEVAQRESCRAKGATRPIREKMLGFELADIAFMKPSMRLKQHTLDWFATGWAPLLDEVQFTFFYEGLPDLIVSGKSIDHQTSSTAVAWRNIPTGFNLLTASLPCLRHLAERCNETSNFDSLTTKYDWNCPGVVFTDHVESEYFLQELAPKGKANSPQFELATAAEGGAVIFRYRHDLKSMNNILLRRQGVPIRAGDRQVQQAQRLLLDRGNKAIADLDGDLKPEDTARTAKRTQRRNISYSSDSPAFLPAQLVAEGLEALCR